MLFHSRRRGLASLATAALLVAGCSEESPTKPLVSMNDSSAANASLWTDLTKASSVTVSIDSSALAPGHTAIARAVAKSRFGTSLRTKTPTWTSSNVTVATVSSSGQVTAKATGTTSIIATIDGVSGRASLAVTSATAATMASALNVQTQPAGATTGIALTTQPAVSVVDASKQIVSTNVAVTAAVASGTATLSGTTTVTASGGVARFTNLVLTGSGSATLKFTSGSLTAATSNAITIAAAATTPAATPTQLVLTTQPSSSVISAAALAVQPAVQLRDASNKAVAKSGVAVTVAIASGSGTLSGTTSATTNASGIATFSGLAITGSGSYTLRFSSTGLTSATSSAISVTTTSSSGGTTPPSSGGSTLPSDGSSGSGTGSADVMNNASFESGWDGFTDWTMGGAPTNASRDASTAYDGSMSLKRSWTPNPSGDNTAQIATRISSAGADHVWLRFYFKLTAPITSIMKFARFYQGTFSSNLGGLFLGSGNDILMFGTDQENSAITTSLGLTQAQVIDGKWHSMEIEYWRNGDPSGYPSAAFWFDGQQLTGTAVKYAGAGNSSYWSNGRLYTGSRKTSNKINVMEWAATLNAGNTTTGQVNIDRVSISTTGRIGQ